MELVKIENGQLLTSSLIVAEVFGKEHKNVLQAIENVECSEQFSRLNFQLSEYTNSRGKKYPCYAITEKGFMFLAMGFTGKTAAEWKEKFIFAFEEMANKLKAKEPQTKLEWIKFALEQEEQKLLLENKVENLSTALDSLSEWTSIIKVCQFNKVKESKFDWRKLKAKSLELGFEIKKAESRRFSYQNLYHVNVFKACYPQYKYDFLNK